MAAMPGAKRRLDLFERMLRIRRFEEAIIQIAPRHPYIGRQHLCVGHEATAGSVGIAMKRGDVAHTTHRNHGYMIGRGVDPAKALAEVLGRSGGTNGGRGGPWHITDTSKGFLSTSAMVGGSIGLAVGAAFAFKRAGTKAVSVAHFGDGTLDEGITYEALNLASIFELPVLFLCENNAKEGQRPSSMLAAKRLADVPKALTIRSKVVDGRDAEVVLKAASSALRRIRREGQPFFLQADLERWPGSHATKPAFVTGVTNLSLAWDEGRISGEHGDWTRDHDVIRRYTKTLLANGDATQDELLAIDKRVGEQMEAAIASAEASPFPAPESALADAYA